MGELKREHIDRYQIEYVIITLNENPRMKYFPSLLSKMLSLGLPHYFQIQYISELN